MKLLRTAIVIAMYVCLFTCASAWAEGETKDESPGDIMLTYMQPSGGQGYSSGSVGGRLSLYVDQGDRTLLKVSYGIASFDSDDILGNVSSDLSYYELSYVTFTEKEQREGGKYWGVGLGNAKSEDTRKIAITGASQTSNDSSMTLSVVYGLERGLTIGELGYIHFLKSENVGGVFIIGIGYKL